jgi:hypothetical protein
MYRLGINEEEYFRLLLSTFQELGFSFLQRLGAQSGCFSKAEGGRFDA